jgi:hypothetical protein
MRSLERATSIAARPARLLPSARWHLMGLPVSSAMTPDVVTISSQATAAELVELFWAHHVSSLPVTDGASVRGIVAIRQVSQVAPNKLREVRVADLMRPLEPDLSLDRLVVLNGSSLVGYLSVKDINHILALGASRAPVSPGGDAAARRLKH